MDGTQMRMDKLVELMAQALVDRPDEVEVRMVEGANTMVLELQVGKGDVGKVIGKQGRTAHAIRTLIGAVSSKIKKRTVLEIIDENRDSDFRIPMEASRSAENVITSYTRR